MPVYNEQTHVADAIASLRLFDYPNYEIVISDNCSTDDTRAICVAAASADQRIRFFTTDQNRGAGWNFQRDAIT
jgi:glycosyltransferase involved in cell wall biosynthesis